MEDSFLSKKKLTFNQGSNYFRQRLVLSLLSARPVKITEIRSDSPYQVGVTDYEVSFIRLLDKVSNGSRFKINETGTEVSFVPGTLAGGVVAHVCHESRPVSYYLEPFLLLAPFCKKPLKLTLKGRLQNDSVGYNSVYKVKHAGLPIMEIFGLEPDLQIKHRSFEESEVLFTCTVKKQLLTLRTQLNQEAGKVKKVRGLAYGFRVPPQLLNRIGAAAKGVFLPYISDAFVTNDPVKSKSKNPGYGLVLYAETTKNIHYAADGFVGREELEKAKEGDIMNSGNLDNGNRSKRAFDLFAEGGDDDQQGSKTKKQKLNDDAPHGIAIPLPKVVGSYSKSPEELGIAVAKQLLSEIVTESRVDSVFQWLVLGFMALGPKDVSSAVMGPLTPFTVQFLRDLKTFFGTTFKVEDFYKTLKKKKKPITEDDEGEEDVDSDEDDDSSKKKKLFRLSCLGTGYINLNKTMV